MAFYIIFTIILLATIYFSIRFFGKGKKPEQLEKFIKVLTVAFITLSMLHLFLPDLFVSPIGDSALEMPGGRPLAIIRWLNAICFTVLPIAIYQKNKYFEKIT